MKKTLFLLLAALGALGVSGCFNRTHMSPNYGRAYRQAFARQAVNQSASTKIPKGLDAMEASVVSATYRKQLAPASGAVPTDQGMILLSPQAPGGSPAIIPTAR